MNRLLFIDGNDIHQMYTGMVFKRLGVEVDYLVEATDAIKTFTQGDYHLILIDLDEHPLAGFELGVQFRAIDSQVPIVGITDLAEIEVMYRALHYGMNYCIERSDLLETLDKCLIKASHKDVA